MNEKKGKIIEFEEKTIDLVHKYGKIRGISTFSGVIREMVANELERYGIITDTSEDNESNPNVKSSLPPIEQQYYEDINNIIEIYKKVQAEYSKIFSDLEKKESKLKNSSIGKTTFERFALCGISEKQIDHLFEVVKLLFTVKEYGIVRIDKVLNVLSNSNLRWRKDFDIYSIDNLEEIDIRSVEILISTYIEAQINKERVDNENIIMSCEDEYNDLMAIYFEYKKGNSSEYTMIRVISDYIDKTINIK
ncbi:hypothetical protein AALK46_12600 [Staphylococcus nepalensis]|uniref:hypothetical protein n=1 Tax=Staphylococcus TaxID=1279 RepID=UPI002DB9BBE0|nr:hypothetical protein [Staphylococcus pseudoxylosus]MEB6038179.1 hypothetical protein [Staphylococcus pseudoxylosus]